MATLQYTTCNCVQLLNQLQEMSTVKQFIGNESESGSHYITDGQELSPPEELRDDELAAEELNDCTLMYGDEMAPEVNYEEFRDDYDANQLMQAAEESRHEGNYELISAGEELTNCDEDNGSFDDQINDTDSELGYSSDINASDSEYEDATANREGTGGSHEEGDNQKGQHDHDDDPIYPGATITVKVMMILILAFTTRHKLTNEALSDLLYVFIKHSFSKI